MKDNKNNKSQDFVDDEIKPKMDKNDPLYGLNKILSNWSSQENEIRDDLYSALREIKKIKYFNIILIFISIPEDGVGVVFPVIDDIAPGIVVVAVGICLIEAGFNFMKIGLFI